MKRRKIKTRKRRMPLSKERKLDQKKKKMAREKQVSAMGLKGRLLSRLIRRKERMVAESRESPKLTLKKILLLKFRKQGKDLFDETENSGKDKKKKP